MLSCWWVVFVSSRLEDCGWSAACVGPLCGRRRGSWGSGDLVEDRRLLGAIGHSPAGTRLNGPVPWR